MRSQMALPDSISGWCFWSSIVALMMVIGVILVGAAAGAGRAEGVAEVLLKIVQFGFVVVIGLFLLGAVCTLVEGARSRWRL